MEHDKQNFLSFFDNFLPFYPSKNQKNPNFEKMKRNAWIYYHFTKVYQKSWSYTILFLRYGTWRMYNCYFSFWAIFCPFTPWLAQKIKISKKWKKCRLEISSFYTSAPKIMIICYIVSEMGHVTDVILIFYFGLFFVLLPPNLPKKWKFQKNEKSTWRYHHFAQAYQKSWS